MTPVIPVTQIFRDACYTRQKVVNYMWLSNKPETPSSEAARNPLLSRHSERVAALYIGNFLTIAGMTPDADFVLWVDHALLSEASIRFLTDMCRTAETKNVYVRDLKEIAKYRALPLFQAGTDSNDAPDSPLWKKVDLARLLVLEHVLATTRVQQVFYSDMDIVDPQVSTPQMQKILDGHGMAFVKIVRHTGSNPSYLENSFTGLTRQGEAFLTDRLLPVVQEGRYWRETNSMAFACSPNACGRDLAQRRNWQQ